MGKSEVRTQALVISNMYNIHTIGKQLFLNPF